MKRTTGHLTEKNGKWYAVINLYDSEGRRKEKWHSLDLPVKKGNKTEANHRFQEVLGKYNTGDLYVMETLTKAEQERRRIADTFVEDFVSEFVEQYKNNIAPNTYEGYRRLVDKGMKPYFAPLCIKLKEVDGDVINAYYRHLFEKGCKGTSAQRHHALLHLAFKNAVKRKIIPTNPCEQADRPKSQQYIASYYNANELKQLLDCLEGDPLRIPIILGAYYGLRRSEALGLKWDAVDFDAGVISIRHKVIDVENQLLGLDVMKTKSSYRTLPLIPAVAEELKRERARQEEMQRVLRGSYNKQYLGYICVDAIGNLLPPRYVSEHFKVLLRHNSLREIRFHDLRHSCASLLLANEVPMKMIQDWLGHSDMGTTANIYSHIDSNSKKESANAIGNALGSF